MKLISNTKQRFKNSVSNYMVMRLKFRSDAFAGKTSSASHGPVELAQATGAPAPTITPAGPIIRH
jgi:hypothetical protein